MGSRARVALPAPGRWIRLIRSVRRTIVVREFVPLSVAHCVPNWSDTASLKLKPPCACGSSMAACTNSFCPM